MTDILLFGKYDMQCFSVGKNVLLKVAPRKHIIAFLILGSLLEDVDNGDHSHLCQLF